MTAPDQTPTLEEVLELRAENAELRKKLAAAQDTAERYRGIVANVNINAELRNERDARLKSREREFARRVKAHKEVAAYVLGFETTVNARGDRA